MPSTWAHVDAEFPTFTGEEKATDQIAALQNYMFVLTEQLKYSMRNLDMSNWNAAALQSYTEGNASPLLQEISNVANRISQVASSADRLSTRVTETERNVGDVTKQLELLTESGLVTEDRLKTEGSVTLHPGNIAPGEIKEMEVSGSSITGSEFITQSDGLSGAIKLLHQTLLAGEIRGDTNQLLLKTCLAAGIAFGILIQSAGNLALDAEGNVTITGQDIHLNGNVYINGTRMEGEESE